MALTHSPTHKRSVLEDTGLFYSQGLSDRRQRLLTPLSDPWHTPWLSYQHEGF